MIFLSQGNIEEATGDDAKLANGKISSATTVWPQNLSTKGGDSVYWATGLSLLGIGQNGR